MNLNKIFILGNLTRDPEARSTPTGQNISSFAIATNRTWTNTNGEKQEEVEFHNIVAWGRLAEICNQYLSKGRLIFVEGRVKTRSWEDKDGNKRYRTEIIAENMQMGPRSQASSNREIDETLQEGVQTDSLEENYQKSKKESTDNEEEIEVKDIPF